MAVKGAPAYSPHTDAEIALKLRMAGFSKNQIGITLAESPSSSTWTPTRNIYLNKGIAPW